MVNTDRKQDELRDKFKTNVTTGLYQVVLRLWFSARLGHETSAQKDKKVKRV